MCSRTTWSRGCAPSCSRSTRATSGPFDHGHRCWRRSTPCAAPFDQRADLTHVTGSAVVVGRRGVVLLVHRRLGRLDATGWPHRGRRSAVGRRGARVDRGDGARWFAIPTAGRCSCTSTCTKRPTNTCTSTCATCCSRPTTDPNPPAGESQQVRWFSWDDAADVADESLRGALATASSAGGRAQLRVTRVARRLAGLRVPRWATACPGTTPSLRRASGPARLTRPWSCGRTGRTAR